MLIPPVEEPATIRAASVPVGARPYVADDAESPRRTGWFFLVLVILLAVLAGLLFAFARSLGILDTKASTVGIPPVIGKTYNVARAELLAKGFAVTRQPQDSNTVAEGPDHRLQTEGGNSGTEGLEGDARGQCRRRPGRHSGRCRPNAASGGVDHCGEGLPDERRDRDRSGHGRRSGDQDCPAWRRHRVEDRSGADLRVEWPAHDVDDDDDHPADHDDVLHDLDDEADHDHDEADHDNDEADDHFIEHDVHDDHNDQAAEAALDVNQVAGILVTELVAREPIS